MRNALSAAALTAVLLSLSGCAASLVYDRDRPAGDCRDRQERCLNSAIPARQPAIAPVALAGGRLASLGGVTYDQVEQR